MYRFRNINFEFRDFKYYNPDDRFKKKELELEFNFEISSEKKNHIDIFLHLKFSYPVENKYFELFHADYLANFPSIKKNDFENFDKQKLAHCLGISILMMKGAFYTSTQNSLLKDFVFPVLNPLDILEKKYPELKIVQTIDLNSYADY